MGWFWNSKTKISPIEFVNKQLDLIFSDEFKNAEKNDLNMLSKNYPMIGKVNIEEYLLERQNIIYNIVQLAWDRNTPHDIFIKYSMIMVDDPRVKRVNSGIYDRCLSNAQEAGMDTFGYLAMLFMKQILPGSNIGDGGDGNKLFDTYKNEYTLCFKHHESMVRGHKIIDS